MRRARKAAAGSRQQSIVSQASVEVDTGADSSANQKLPTAPTEAEEDELYDKSVLDVLAEGVHNSWSLLHSAVIEFLACKDEILKHALPPALLLRVVVSTTKIFRLFSDANTPVLELLRLVKLYSADWEQQSVVLKKLHADNESKQRQLNIALRRIEMTAMEQQRMAKERRVMNWERLFAKMQNQQSHGRRWKFTMQAFKDKLRDGRLNPESYGPTNSDDENGDNCGDGRSIASGRAGARSNFRLSSREGSQCISDVTLDDGNNSDREVEEEREDTAVEDDDTRSPMQNMSPVLDEAASEERVVAQISSLQSIGDEDEDAVEAEDSSLQLHAFSSSTTSNVARHSEHRMSSHRVSMRELQRRDVATGTSTPTVSSSRVTQPLVAPVETKDVAVATHERAYERCLGLRIYPPKDVKGVPKTAATLSMGEFIYDTPVFESTTNSTEYHEMLFELPADAAPKTPKGSDVQVDGNVQEDSSSDKTLNVVLHSKSAQGPIIAMGTISLGDLLEDAPEFLLSQDAGDCGDEEQLAGDLSSKSKLSASEIVTLNKRLPVDHELRPLVGGTSSALPLVAFQIKREIPPVQLKATNTSAIEELMGEMAIELGYVSVESANEMVTEREEVIHAMYRENNAVMAEEANKVKKTQEEDIEKQAMEHAAEMMLLQEKYEKEISALHDSLTILAEERDQAKASAEAREIEAAPAATAGSSEIMLVGSLAGDVKNLKYTVDTESQPVLTKQSHSLSVRFADPDSPIKRRYVKATHPMPEDWMANFPADFLDRLAMFNKESMKRQQEMVTKVTKQVKSILTRQMAAQHRLARQGNDESDLCLPALYLPTSRPNMIYNPRAHSYFHPFGTGTNRVTQPPSILKLPAIPPKPQATLATVNLFDLSQQYVTNGPYWWKGGQGTIPGLGSNPPPSMAQISTEEETSSRLNHLGGETPVQRSPVRLQNVESQLVHTQPGSHQVDLTRKGLSRPTTAGRAVHSTGAAGSHGSSAPPVPNTAADSPPMKGRSQSMTTRSTPVRKSSAKLLVTGAGSQLNVQSDGPKSPAGL